MKAKDLRNSILHLAVQGKLVPQDSNDEPASVLLERIRAERTKLIKEKKIRASKGGESMIYRASDGSHYEKRGKEEPVCIEDEIPFEIPESWEWVRLGVLFDMQAGKNISAARISDIEDDEHPYPCFGGNGVRGYVKSPNRSGSHPIIGRQGALCGCVNYADGEFYATEHAVVATCFAGTDTQWACLVLEALNLNQYATATAQPGLAVSKIAEILISVPPVQEQIRIVQHVVNLILLITDYDVLEASRERLDTELPGRLRKSILQQAVQGKLVAQNPSDEPASALLKRIRAERAKLVKAGKLKAPKGGESVIYRSSDGGYYEKRSKGEPVCIDDEIPFEIPDSWEWVRFTWAVPVSYGFPADSALFNVNGAIGLIRIRDVNSGDLIHTETRYDGDYNQRYIVHAGDDLIGMDGEFRCLRWKGEDSLLNQRVCRLDYLSDTACTDYVRIALEWYLGEVWKRTSKTTVKHLSAKALDTMLFALPPYEEQIRIAAIINAYLEVQG